ncbi:dTDP-4-dehydrorhamnose 3,5-epimerase [Myroides guanonis]|uniref:dTDP-4-dehydrorhamnose 3,5-epimerase n=1 Tax=Myroides guanonis TaxID=1150112 RepID=A0A1I3RK22_9FLAO|nr:dTDP-4-dehydrorhamnose 3,5-epimerase [Myroides guanonis]SFJ46943.1 dTDP-4-dehydrorhamnose 3,5-epimerase [Myroides guanonis]
MEVTKTEIEDCFILKPQKFEDERGYFFESFNEAIFRDKTGLLVHFVQDNQSFSSKGVLRGLHFQTGVHQQAKLVRVIQGEVLDVVVDLRKDSKTYGKHIKEILSDTNQKQVFIPRGFAHGFLVLSETAIFSYKCDNYYNRESEGGIIYNDESLGIDWMLRDEDFLISEKDLVLPKFKDVSPL